MSLLALAVALAACDCEQALRATGFAGAERAVAGEVDFYNDSSARCRWTFRATEIRTAVAMWR